MGLYVRVWQKLPDYYGQFGFLDCGKKTIICNFCILDLKKIRILEMGLLTLFLLVIGGNNASSLLFMCMLCFVSLKKLCLKHIAVCVLIYILNAQLRIIMFMKQNKTRSFFVGGSVQTNKPRFDPFKHRYFYPVYLSTDVFKIHITEYSLAGLKSRLFCRLI